MARRSLAPQAIVNNAISAGGLQGADSCSADPQATGGSSGPLRKLPQDTAPGALSGGGLGHDVSPPLAYARPAGHSGELGPAAAAVAQQQQQQGLVRAASATSGMLVSGLEQAAAAAAAAGGGAAAPARPGTGTEWALPPLLLQVRAGRVRRCVLCGACALSPSWLSSSPACRERARKRSAATPL